MKFQIIIVNYWIVKYGYGIYWIHLEHAVAFSSSRTQKKLQLQRFDSLEIYLNNIEVSVGSNSKNGNSGTSFHNANFANALNDLPNANTIYIDLNPSNIENGTIFSPHKTVVKWSKWCYFGIIHFNSSW